MRYLLKAGETAETLLERAAQSAFRVVEGVVPDNQREDVEMGLYVALRRVFHENVVRSEVCGSLPTCDHTAEELAFTGRDRAAGSGRGH
jgi:hypothetical protein